MLTAFDEDFPTYPDVGDICYRGHGESIISMPNILNRFIPKKLPVLCTPSEMYEGWDQIVFEPISNSWHSTEGLGAYYVD